MLDLGLPACSTPTQPQSLAVPSKTYLFQEFESQIVAAIANSLEARFQHLVDEVDNLKKKVEQLEGRDVGGQLKREEEVLTLHTKIDAMTAILTNQQILLEIRKRTNRPRNIIIVGQPDEE